MILDRAQELGRIVFTQDKDFLGIVQARQVSGENFAGVIDSAQKGPTIRQCIDDLELASSASSADDWLNVLKYLPL